MKIAKKLTEFGDLVFEIECNRCSTHFYYDRSRSTGDSVRCLICSNTERWEVIEKGAINLDGSKPY